MTEKILIVFEEHIHQFQRSRHDNFGRHVHLPWFLRLGFSACSNRSRLDLHGRLCRQDENTCISSGSETKTSPTTSYNLRIRYLKLTIRGSRKLILWTCLGFSACSTRNISPRPSWKVMSTVRKYRHLI